MEWWIYPTLALAILAFTLLVVGLCINDNNTKQTFYKGNSTFSQGGITTPLYSDENMLSPKGTLETSTVALHKFNTISYNNNVVHYIQTPSMHTIIDNARKYKIHEDSRKITLEMFG